MDSGYHMDLTQFSLDRLRHVLEAGNLLPSERILAHDMAEKLLKEGIYVIGFSYPVVPKGKARIRVQISAAHERKDLDRALQAFAKMGKELGALRS